MPRSTPYSTLLLGLLLLLSVGLTRAGRASGEVVERWARTYTTPGNQSDYVYQVAVDAAGNSYVAGAVQTAAYGLDALLLKYDRQGSLLWERAYHRTETTANDLPKTLCVDPAGNVLVAGTTNGGLSGTDVLLLKYDPAGNLLWDRTYNGTGNPTDYPAALRVDAGGDAYLAGASGADILTLRYAADGEQLWARVYNGPDNKSDYAVDLELDAAGNVFVGGSVEGPPVFGAPDWDYVVLKYLPSGGLVADRIYDTWSLGWNTLVALAVDRQGNVFVTGENHGPSGKTNVETVKYDNNLEQLWYYWYNNEYSGEDIPIDLATDTAGNAYALSRSEVRGKFLDYLLVKYSPGGEKLWETSYGSTISYGDNPRALVIDDQDRIFVTGEVLADSGLKWDIVTVRFNPEGGTYWAARHESPSTQGEGAAGLAVDPAGNVYVAGNTPGNGTGTDILLLKYAQSPEAGPDGYALPEDQPLVVSAPGVLTNDQGDSLTAEALTQPAHGTLVLQADGSFTYTPDADYAGPDQFTYRVSDGTTTSAPATVAFTITPVDDAPLGQGDEFELDEDTSLIQMAPGVLGNDLDLEGDPLSAVLLSAPTHGTLLLQTNGSFTYQPAANHSGGDSFTYRTVAGGLESEPTTVNLTVHPVNDAPMATPQAVSTAEDTAVIVTLSGTDPDGDSLSYFVVDAPQHGTLTGTPPALTFTPATDYSGPDQFTFRAKDGTAESAPATVSLTITPVNDPPVPESDSYTATEDQVLVVPAPGVLGNDLEREGEPLTATLYAAPAHGTVALAADGSFTYTPQPNYAGPDQFRYRADDGQLQSAAVTVLITVQPVNDAPVAFPQSLATPEDTPRSVYLKGFDPEASPLTYAVVTAPLHGTLSGTPPALTYTPSANYSGPDEFTFRVGDGTAESAPAKVGLTVVPVNDAPVAVDDHYTLNEDTPLQVVTPGVLGNDTDPEGDSLTVTLVSGPAHGACTLDPNGTLRYTPAADYSGPDALVYRASDGKATSVATVHLTVSPVPDLPTAANLALTAAEDTALLVSLSGRDADGDPLIYEVVTGPVHGTLTGTGASRTYRPAADYSGIDQFTYRVVDGTGASAPATVSLTITPVNDAPVAQGQHVVTAEDTPVTITLTATDREGSPLTYQVVGLPLHGALSGTAPNLTYTPSLDYVGSDRFTFRADDGEGESELATVTLAITAGNDAPRLLDDTFQVAEDTTLKVPADGVLANDLDPEGSELLALLASGPQHGRVILDLDGSFQYVPDPNCYGPDSFTYFTTDGERIAGPATVRITVTPINDPPVATPLARTTVEDTPVSLTLIGSDGEGEALTFRVVAGPEHGTLSGTLPNVTYTPAPDYSGADHFTFVASDGTAESAPVQATLAVTPVNDAPTAQPEGYQTPHATLLQVPAPGLLGNDHDPDGDPLQAQLVQAPTGGDLALQANGGFTYRPRPGFSGEDAFTYRVTDGTTQSAPVRVTLTVGEVPASTTGQVSGNGTLLLESGAKANFSLSASIDRKGRLKGQFTFRDAVTRQQVKSTALTALVVEGNRARVFGRARINGGAEVAFVAEAWDQPAPAKDQVALAVSGGPSFAAVALTSGKVTIKP